MEALIIVLLAVVIIALLFFVWEGRESPRAVEAKLESQAQELTRSVTVANERLQQAGTGPG